MPRIPMSDRGYVPHVEGGVRMTGAPGMGFGMENARGLRDVANGLDGLGEGAMKVYGALKLRAEAAQEAEDTDNMQALELQEMQATNDLNAFMRENPGRYLDFENELQTRTKNLTEARTGYLEKMSPNARRRAEFYLKKTDLDRANNVRYVGWQAQATAKMQNLETRLSDLAKIGADDAAIQMIDEYTVGDAPLLTQPMSDQFKAKYWEQRDFFQVREQIDAGDPDVLEKLNKKSDGQFTEYTHLTREQRERLKQYAEQKDVERELQTDLDVMTSFTSGDPRYTDKEQVKKDLDEGKITKKQYIKYAGFVDDYNAQLERERKQREAEVERVQKERASIILTAQKEQEAIRKAQEDAEKAAKKEQEAAEKAAHDELVADWMLNIELTNFSTIPEVNAQQKKKLYEGAQEGIKDSPSLLKILKALNERSQTGLNGTDEFSSPNGKLVKDYILKKFMNKSRTEFTGLIYRDGFWSNGDDSQAFQSSRFLEVYELAKTRLTEGKDYFTIKTEIDECVAALNAGKVQAILMRSADDWKLPAAPRTMVSMMQPEEKKPDRSYKGDAIVRASVPMWPR